MLGRKAQCEVPGRHLTRVGRWSSGYSGPELSDFLDMFGPILNPLGKERTNLAVLANVCIKMLEEPGNGVPAAEPVVERSDLAHRGKDKAENMYFKYIFSLN